jgi:zinc-ribbon domain
VILPVLFPGFFPGYGLGFLVVALLAVWVGMDAEKRGMSGILWGIGVFLLCIIFLPIYLIVRKPLLPQQPYGYPPVQPPPGTYPPAAQPGHFCSNCGTHIDPAARFCPNCGKPAQS